MPLLVLPVPARLTADALVIIDVLRFTTSAAYALANGARSIVPCASLEQARALKAADAGLLLAGERNAMRPDGFDLGNSPLEFARGAVQGKDLAWTTTNGTRAIATVLGNASAVRTPSSVPAGCDLSLASYVNLRAVASVLEPVLRADAVVAVVCSGRDGSVALEDCACAGALVRLLREAVGGTLTIDDGARACACIDEAYGEDIARLFCDAEHGRFLRAGGFGSDLEACAALDALTVVPRWRDGRFVAG